MQLVRKGSQEIHLMNKKIAQYISFSSFFTDRNPIYRSSFTHENVLILTNPVLAFSLDPNSQA